MFDKKLEDNCASINEIVSSLNILKDYNQNQNIISEYNANTLSVIKAILNNCE
jgi:hypothetical protein